MANKKTGGYKIVLTADRTLMSEYNGGIFLGFSACVPRGIIPDILYFSIFCPSVEVNRGVVKYAPCGTRKIEAALLSYGFKRDEITVAHPDFLGEVVGSKTKVIGITENDPLGIGPATSTFTQLFGGEAYMAAKFRELLENPAIQAYKPKIIVGGPGAWQLEDDETRRGLGIDCVVIGEAEKIVGLLFDKAINGEQLPGVVYGEVVNEEEIPIIAGPTINGIVEVARGCGRGCSFCEPTLQRYRCLPIEHILKEVEVNLRAGKMPLLHAEDVLKYGAKGLDVNKEAVYHLFKAVKNHPGVNSVGISHFALSSVASAPEVVEEISNILNAGSDRRYISGQTGIETGSPRLIQRHLAGKCKPFSPREWPKVVVDAFQTLSDNAWISVSTIIIGLPGETDEDAVKTIELIEELRPFRSLIIPLFLVSMGGLKDRSVSFTLDGMSPRQGEAFIKCWEHNLNWIPRIFEDYYCKVIKNGIARRGIKLVLSYGISQGKELMKICEKDYGYDIPSMQRDFRNGKIKVASIPARLLQSCKLIK
ncbi:B12-binding domain-containing radical SAM protein [Candidatus Bathyarchaeota archaeon]|nr:B12-binding domain-containing radical SAM protein [Candidatus Bathyarchaeota archaeon]MBS7630601.1 B12-binding domain-containing radical SAM protein [Candidatus Bathyarchaeota archaeon]